MGEEAWRDFESWPPPGYPPRRVLPGGPAARLAPPSRPPSRAPDRYRYDPADPTPAVGGVRMVRATAGRVDNTALEARPDVLTYTTAPLEADVEVIGEVSAEIWFRSSLAARRRVRPAVRRRPARPVLERLRRPDQPVPAPDDGHQGDGPAVADRLPLQARPPDPGPGLQRRLPALRAQPRQRRAARHRHPPAGRPTSRSTTTRRTRRRSSCRSASADGAAAPRQKNSKYSRISQSLTSVRRVGGPAATAPPRSARSRRASSCTR